MISFKGKPAYKVNAKLLTQTDSAYYLDIDGDNVWIPKRLCEYNDRTKSVVILDWFYNMKFPNG